MTVAELIEKLNRIKNKSQSVYVSLGDVDISSDDWLIFNDGRIALTSLRAAEVYGSLSADFAKRVLDLEDREDKRESYQAGQREKLP